ncbi:hypothetical protein [Candidatus Nephthysia bennettiae]|uniref:Glycerophosphoryl diester phosphodiesterase membrane domain-containing protein n=1 Tax=Candidatus Nephthysia bennettiae TaxID=3127016 RepID=A0A934K501_9BACT|nr:hypothetical protein [Candidatus Dormibacteraeota bacterium]MBJ7612158.1 hypothetical protein [Candidatus Dormibacteraeota bacterium]
MRYGEVVQRSLLVFWRYRYLWLLGALGGGESVGGGFGNFGVAGQGPGGPSDTGTGSLPDQLSTQFGQWFLTDLPLLAALLALLALFGVVYFFLSCVSVGATVRAAAEHDAERPFGLGLAWRAGRQSFLPILGLRLLGVLIALPAVALVAGLVALATISEINGSGDGIVTAALAAVIVVPLLGLAALLLGVAWTLATRSIVLEQQGVRGALRRAFGQLSRQPGRVALLWLITLGAGIFSGLAAGIAAGVLLLPFVAILAATYAAAGVDAALSPGAVMLLFYVVAVVFLNGAVGSFLTTYWTVAFRRLDQEPKAAVPAPAGSV